MTEEKFVPLHDLAKDLGLGKPGARAYAKRHGVEFVLLYDHSRRGQLVSCITKEDRDRLLKDRAATSL
ncbi:MAG: hypothetical protein WBN07_05515 [Woeseiaceae bacterium]